MSILPESQTGIWLNTPVRFLNAQSEKALAFAQNDSDWRFYVNDFNQITNLADLDPDGSCEKESWAYFKESFATDSHLYNNPCRTLYTHVKFKVATEIVTSYYFKCKNITPSFKLTALDIGCSIQMLRRHLKKTIEDTRYIGVDCVPTIYPDILCDVSSDDVSQALNPVRPNVVVALDVLPMLHNTPAELSATLSRWVQAMDEKPGLYVFTIPECYDSEEHLLKMSSEQWLKLLNKLFVIEDVQAVGFLSALPYWIGKKPLLKPKGLLQRSLNVLKEPLYDSHVLKSIESVLTRLCRRKKILRRFSHTLVVSARSRETS
jgi:hypothetical protein